MGVMGRILGAGGAVREVGAAVGGVAEVFVGNRAEREAAEAAAFSAVLGQAGAEFAQVPASRFDGFVNGLNRLPRPMLALGTLALFVYAMAEPSGFGLRMQGLALVPDPLWWLLGAIVSFYFGARELHYWRGGNPAPAPRLAAAVAVAPADDASQNEAATTALARVAGPARGAEARPATAEATGDTPGEAPAEAKSVAAAPAALLGRGPASRKPVVVRAADPEFNAALEEWRALRA